MSTGSSISADQHTCICAKFHGKPVWHVASSVKNLVSQMLTHLPVLSSGQLEETSKPASWLATINQPVTCQENDDVIWFKFASLCFLTG